MTEPKTRTDEDQTFSSCQPKRCEETHSKSRDRSEIRMSSDGDTGEISSEVLDELSCDLRTLEHQTSPSAADEENTRHLSSRERPKYKSMSYCDPSVKITHTHTTLRFTDTFNF